MTILFFVVSLVKLIVLGFFLLINWNDNGSPGWAFQHLFFFYIILFLLLPVSFFEKAILVRKGINIWLCWIPVLIAVINLIPLYLGNWSTKAFIFTQIIGILFTVTTVILYLKSNA
jgi:hypothetical protein